MGMNGTLQKTAVDSFVFQPTPPHGDEHTKRKSLWNSTRIITTHTPHGDERHTTNWKETIIYFNTHLPHGGWTDSWYLQTNHMITFQPTPPHGGWTWDPRSGRRINNNFNPHPRMGMNVFVFCNCNYLAQFQPTPPYGDEHCFFFFSCFMISLVLQPTPPYGDEQTWVHVSYLHLLISTHTPVWGWTAKRINSIDH